jgi:hypothetical protein
MFFSSRKSAFLALLACFFFIHGAIASSNEPTIHDIYEAAKSGQMANANKMIDEVVRAHPNSAKAHFVKAELQAKQGQFSSARDELMYAKRLQPDLSFVDANSLRQLEQRLSQRASSSSASLAHSIPWGIIFLGLFLLFFAFVVYRRFTGQRQTYQAPTYPNTMGGYGAQPYPASNGGMGSGILGGLATGAAIGAGMVAGEALAHNLMGDNRIPEGSIDNQYDSSVSNENMGGEDFGVNDGGSWDDSGSDFSDIGGGDWS